MWCVGVCGSVWSVWECAVVKVPRIVASIVGRDNPVIRMLTEGAGIGYCV